MIIAEKVSDLPEALAPFFSELGALLGHVGPLWVQSAPDGSGTFLLMPTRGNMVIITCGPRMSARGLSEAAKPDGVEQVSIDRADVGQVAGAVTGWVRLALELDPRAVRRTWLLEADPAAVTLLRRRMVAARASGAIPPEKAHSVARASRWGASPFPLTDGGQILAGGSAADADQPRVYVEDPLPGAVPRPKLRGPSAWQIAEGVAATGLYRHGFIPAVLAPGGDDAPRRVSIMESMPGTCTCRDCWTAAMLPFIGWEGPDLARLAALQADLPEGVVAAATATVVDCPCVPYCGGLRARPALDLRIGGVLTRIVGDSPADCTDVLAARFTLGALMGEGEGDDLSAGDFQ